LCGDSPANRDRLDSPDWSFNSFDECVRDAL